MKSSLTKTSHSEMIINHARFSRIKSPETSSLNGVPRIEFGAGRGRLGQAIPTCGAGQVMTIEKQIINR